MYKGTSPESANQTHDIGETIFFRLTSFGIDVLNQKFRDEVSLEFMHTYPKDKNEIDRRIDEARAQHISTNGIVSMTLTKFAETFGGHIDGHIHPIIENGTISFINPDEATQY